MSSSLLREAPRPPGNAVERLPSSAASGTPGRSAGVWTPSAGEEDDLPQDSQQPRLLETLEDVPPRHLEKARSIVEQLKGKGDGSDGGKKGAGLDANNAYLLCFQLLKLAGLEAEIPRLVVFGQQSMGKTTLLGQQKSPEQHALPPLHSPAASFLDYRSTLGTYFLRVRLVSCLFSEYTQHLPVSLEVPCAYRSASNVSVSCVLAALVGARVFLWASTLLGSLRILLQPCFPCVAHQWIDCTSEARRSALVLFCHPEACVQFERGARGLFSHACGSAVFFIFFSPLSVFHPCGLGE